MTDDKRADNESKTPHAKPDAREKGGHLPPAGPHARPDLTNQYATPGAGVLPDKGNGDEADGGAG